MPDEPPPAYDLEDEQRRPQVVPSSVFTASPLHPNRASAGVSSVGGGGGPGAAVSPPQVPARPVTQGRNTNPFLDSSGEPVSPASAGPGRPNGPYAPPARPPPPELQSYSPSQPLANLSLASPTSPATPNGRTSLESNEHRTPPTSSGLGLGQAPSSSCSSRPASLSHSQGAGTGSASPQASSHAGASSSTQAHVRPQGSRVGEQNTYIPTTVPTPGQPLLREGKLLVYPKGHMCQKCKWKEREAGALVGKAKMIFRKGQLMASMPGLRERQKCRV